MALAKKQKSLRGMFASLPFMRSNRRNGRVFRTQQDAYAFVRKAYKETGGPTAELRKLHAEYEEYKRARKDRPS